MKPLRKEDQELITNSDLVAAAHMLMGEIDLDPASSHTANEYVGAIKYFTPQDDGLNAQQWFGKVYLFPPSGSYFFNKALDKWRMTRVSAGTVTSSHAVWFQRLYRAWLNNEIEQGLFFTNCPDMIRYEQKIFDFPQPQRCGRQSTNSRHQILTSPITPKNSPCNDNGMGSFFFERKYFYKPIVDIIKLLNL